MADFNCRIELSRVQTLVCLCRMFVGGQSFKAYSPLTVSLEIRPLVEDFLSFSLLPYIYAVYISCLRRLLSQHTNKLPVHGAFSTADVSGLHLSGHEGLAKCQAPAHYKRR